jgi:hypothetical protein
MREFLLLFLGQRSVDKIVLARKRLRAHDGIPHFEIRLGKAGTDFGVNGVMHRH